MFVHRLIWSLGNEIYINELNEEQDLFPYEYIKRGLLSTVKDDLLKRIFIKAESHILNSYQYEVSKDICNNEKYKTLLRCLTMFVLLFNESTYLSPDKLDHYLESTNPDSALASKIREHPHTSENIFASDISPNAFKFYHHTFSVLLRWFQLVYEMKFIFGNINLKFTNKLC
ncbi:hypothetical protein RF11_11627 [Thelohanellus kitauei]|uniref:Uncharacterized protein n=1 Tax=Thelohanellus kitauei TaxID=669202 RepID=A0A0C2J238_THEKT|nr:hypothetical protein RF11_11627 [Thelohanellus kitauei]